MKRTLYVVSFVLLTFFLFNALPGYSQVRERGLHVGISGGAVKYHGEFSDDLFGLVGEFQAMYAPSKYVSLGAGISLSDIQWRVTRATIDRYPDYFGPNARIGGTYPGTVATIEDRNATRASAYEFLLQFNLLPNNPIMPYVGAGIGSMGWSPTNATEHTNLPNNEAGKYERSVGVFPVFAGINWHLSDDISLYTRATHRFVQTPYLDDVKGPDGSNDRYSTFCVGLQLHTLGIRDTDRDGIPDDEEIRYGSDIYQTDSDGDGLGDLDEIRLHGSDPRKADTDADNLTDFEEISYAHSSPIKRDTDGDGVTDEVEYARGSNPRAVDTDGDGLTDFDEIFTYKSNPTLKDTDDDGLSDDQEVSIHGTMVLKPDTDGDGLTDGEEIRELRTNPLLPDTDRDLLTDGEEVLHLRTDPIRFDTDNDGVMDGHEVRTHKTDPLLTDSDHDGLGDAQETDCRSKTSPTDPDTDGDGIIDSKDPSPGYRTGSCGDSGTNDCKDCGKSGEKPMKVEPSSPKPTPTPPPATSAKRRFTKDIRFRFDSDQMDLTQPETERNLGELLDYLEESCEELQVMIEGHASSEGPAARNLDLSQQRAQAVADWLIDQGVDPSKIRGAVGYGSTQPRIREPLPSVAKTMSKEQLEAVRKQNRRIEIAVMRDCE